MMMRQTISSVWVLATILVLFLCCFGQILSINVDGLLDIPNGEMASNFQVTLNRGEYTTLSKADGAFSFYNVPNGIYLLDVLSVHHVFPQMKIKVATSSTPPVSVVEYKYPGAMRNQAAYPIRLTAIVPLTYFQVKPPLSILGMLLGNPMILIFLVIGGVMVFFPNTIKEIVESEEFKKAQSEQAKQGDPMKKMKQMMGMETSTAADDDDE